QDYLDLLQEMIHNDHYRDLLSFDTLRFRRYIPVLVRMRIDEEYFLANVSACLLVRIILVEILNSLLHHFVNLIQEHSEQNPPVLIQYSLLETAQSFATCGLGPSHFGSDTQR